MMTYRKELIRFLLEEELTETEEQEIEAMYQKHLKEREQYEELRQTFSEAFHSGSVDLNRYNEAIKKHYVTISKETVVDGESEVGGSLG